MRPRRVGALAVAALAVLAMGSSLAAASASTPPKAKKVTISWWTWTANPKNVIANFEKTHPNIIIPTPPDLGVSGAGFYAKLTTALAGGTAPCVSQVEYSELPQYIAGHDLLNIAK